MVSPTSLAVTMSAPPPPSAFGPTVDVRLSYGPLLIGVFFNMILFGVLAAQQLTYFQTARKDPLWMRILVWGVFIVETANTGFDMYIIYQPLILTYGGIPNDLPTLFVTQPMCVMLVAFPIQLFFLWRIRTLTQNTLLPGVILLFALVAFGGGVWTTAMVPIVAKFRNIPQLYRSAEVWLIASGVTDICIAVSLAVALRSKKTGFAPTDSVVDKIIRMTVQTGMLTALFSILDVVCFLTLRGETVNFIWNIPLSKLYSNCLMSTLNARTHFNRRMDVGVSGSSGGRQANVMLSGTGVSMPAFASDRDAKAQETTTFGQEDTVHVSEGQLQFGGIRMTKIVERV
ncbi:hypothetical protein DFH08DRAFT_870663 [Mycena albidolilacea]|uniref:DUF6534 domain-containing protein n=1 Tax=Mycena albidolilacea TaxID=1033008 RepID=A0AAD7EPG0_9AGAR|nr:hypothetical protein DFH08DRAFT_870663 [Mycena albidolilacea]